MKYTDEQIKDAFFPETDREKQLLATINRQEAEIERLKSLLAEWKKAGYKYADSIENIKSEAIKEFAERLKKEALIDSGYEVLQSGAIDNFVKEMVGEGE